MLYESVVLMADYYSNKNKYFHRKKQLNLKAVDVIFCILDLKTLLHISLKAMADSFNSWPMLLFGKNHWPILVSSRWKNIVLWMGRWVQFRRENYFPIQYE